MSAATDSSQSALTLKQRRFVRAFADHGNGARAAREAGYSVNTAREIAHENLSKPHIVEAVEQERRQLLLEEGITPNGVLRAIASIAKFDISEVLDDNGRVKEVSEMSDAARRIVAGIDTFTVTAKDGTSFSTTSKVRIPDRLRAYELLGRHLALFSDQVTLKGDAANPFELIIQQAQGNALLPTAQRDSDDSANAIDDGVPVIDGDIITKTDVPSGDTALSAFNNIEDGDYDNE